MVFGSSLPPVNWRSAHVFIYVICVCLRIVVSNTYYVVVFFCLRLVSYVPNVASFSGLAILDMHHRFTLTPQGQIKANVCHINLSAPHLSLA